MGKLPDSLLASINDADPLREMIALVTLDIEQSISPTGSSATKDLDDVVADVLKACDNARPLHILFALQLMSLQVRKAMARPQFRAIFKQDGPDYFERLEQAALIVATSYDTYLAETSDPITDEPGP